VPEQRAKPPFKHSARTRVAFSDTDAQGIVYYGRYNPYFDLARVEYLRRLDLLRRGEEGMEFVMRANVVEYFAPAVFDDEIEVFCRVARIGRTSLTYEFAAYRETCSWSRPRRRSCSSTSTSGGRARSRAGSGTASPPSRATTSKPDPAPPTPFE
jgi:YbgC/YbaW family acyl-CoA thioester hydrolase